MQQGLNLERLFRLTSEEIVKMGNLGYALIALGVVVMAIAAFLMVEGQILGERTIPAAIVSMIVGIILIASGAKAKKS